ncbi:hypothetical protein Tco_1567513, partial [Tanacetum coccineum]
ITLDQDALDAQAAQSSFHKRSHDNQDLPNNRKGENKKKSRKDVSEPSSRSSRRHRSPVVIVQDDTPAMKKFKELIQKDELTIADLEGARLERLKVQYNNVAELEYHVSQIKAVVLSEAYTEEKYTTSITTHYAARCYKEEEDTIDFFKARMSAVTEGNVYSDLRIKTVVRVVVKKKWVYDFLTSIVVRRFDDQEYEFSYADLPRLSVNHVEDMYLLQV